MIGSLTVMIGYLTLTEKRKQRKVREFEKRQEERQNQEGLKTDLMFREFRDLIREDISFLIQKHIEENHSNLISVKESREDDQRLWKKLEKIEDDLKGHFHESIKSETNRLGTDIMNYADDLRAGIKKSRHSYKHIAHCYDRYKRLGGNHYIDAEFAYIKREMGKLDEED